MNTSGDHSVCDKCNIVMESGVAHGGLIFASETNTSQSGFLARLKMDYKSHRVQVVAYRCPNCGYVWMDATTLRPFVRDKTDDNIIY